MPDPADTTPSIPSDHADSPRRFVIGLAGGIGSGKSTVAHHLADLGCFVTHSDEDVAAVLDDPAVRDTLVQWWGPRILSAPDKRIDRRTLASIVFANPDDRRKLESLIHPLVEARRISAWDAESARRPVPAFVIDAPLLFETGLDKQCDCIIFVDADAPTRQARVAADRGWDPAELDRREKTQFPLDRKRERSDYWIVNQGDAKALRASVESVFQQILKDRRPGAPQPPRPS